MRVLITNGIICLLLFLFFLFYWTVGGSTSY